MFPLMSKQPRSKANRFTQQIQWGAAGLVFTGNIVMFLTIFGFFVAFDNEDFDYSSWGMAY